MKSSRRIKREIRQARVRKVVRGIASRPRLCVFRSQKHIYASIINDLEGHTLVTISSLDKELKSKLKKTGDKAAAKEIGKALAQKCLEQGIKKVVFDRNGFLYHGRVRAVAEGAREAGLEF
jgi:large subunit ribosomal protein L18